MPRTRTPFPTLLLAALALLIPSATGCGTSRLPEGAAWIPSDAAAVIAFDLPALSSTDLYRELKEQGGTVGLNRLNFYKFAEAAGIDPARDVRWLTLVARRHEGETPRLDEFSALVSGTFDAMKIRSFLKDSGMPFETHDGVDIFAMVVVEGRCRFCIAVLDPATAAFGDGDTLKAMAAAKANPGSALARDDAARRLMSRVDRSAAIWGLLRGRDLSVPLGEMLANLRGGGEKAPPPVDIEDVSFFATAGESIVVAVDALASDEEEARLVADVLEGAGAMGRLALKQARPEQADLLSSFTVQVDGRLMRASASFPQARLLELVRSAVAGFSGRLG